MKDERLIAKRPVVVDSQTLEELRKRICPETPSINNVIRVALGMKPTGIRRGRTKKSA